MKTVRKCQSTIGKTVLFQDRKYSIETYVNEHTNKINLVVVIDGFYTDFPVFYSGTGLVNYDNPYKIPMYIKVKVKRMYSNFR